MTWRRRFATGRVRPGRDIYLWSTGRSCWYAHRIIRASEYMPAADREVMGGD